MYMLAVSMVTSRSLLLPVSLLASACLGGVGGDGADGTDIVTDNPDDPDANPNDPDANPNAPDGNSGGTYPTWQLEDIQPQSANFGDVYGLNSFAGKPLVVTLLLGF